MPTSCERITRNITIQDLFAKFPSKAQKMAQALTKIGLNCVGCSASVWETIESGMFRHGFSDQEIEALLVTLNEIAEQETDLSTITLTPRAAQKFIQVSKDEGKEGWGLRFDEEPKGCSGFEYVLGFSEKPTDEDVVFTSNGVDIHVRQLILGRLQGCEIDYVDGLESGFKIVNPNAASSCGCGSSHGYN